MEDVAVVAVEEFITNNNITIIIINNNNNNNNNRKIKTISMQIIFWRLVILVVTICYHHYLNWAIKAITIISNHNSHVVALVGEMGVTTIALFVTVMAQPTITTPQIITPLQRQGTY